MNKRTGTALILMAALSASALAQTAGQPGEELAKAKGCLGCHGVDVGSIGPSFRDIAHRFAGLNNAKPMLTRVVEQGSSRPGIYHWGAVKMPPGSIRSEVSDVEAAQLVDYILGLK